MNINRATVFLALLALSVIVADVEAGWKFWKKKDKDATTTTTEIPSSTTATPSTAKPAVKPDGSPAGKPSTGPNNVGSAVIGAGDPGLAIGVNSNGQNIRNNARPSRPNPGTEVGLDITGTKPARPGTGGNTGQGYRDWAADLTGAGEPGRQPPKTPNQGPALSPGGAASPGVLPAGTKPGSNPTVTPAPRPQPQQPSPQSPGSRPSASPSSPASSPPGSPSSKPSASPGQTQPASNQPSQPGAGGNQVSTLHVGTLKPSSTTSPPPRPGSPGSPGTPGRTWADVAGGGSRPNSPTPSSRQPVYPNQPGQTQPGRGKPSGASIAGGALAGGAIAGGAIAAGTLGGKTGTATTYSSNPTYSKGNGITDEDLEKLSEALFIKDTNNANRYITLNVQKQTTSSSTADDAPQPLFTVNPEAYQGTTIQKIITIYDNYQPDTNVNEHISPLQRQEESLLVDTMLSTNVMSTAMRFLADKGKIRKDYYEYKDTLRKIWFNLFSRGQGKIGSSGFEHVFMAELKNGQTQPEVVGLHNWIYYSKEEATGKVDYNGYLKKVDLGDKGHILKIRTKFNGHDKPVTTLFVGTSPELEMSLYTVCFYARPDANCPVSLGGTKFNIVTHKFKYRGNDLVGTAYPEI
ncbi:uncharacterized protein LOC144471323 [Augochlora pura]